MVIFSSLKNRLFVPVFFSLTFHSVVCNERMTSLFFFGDFVSLLAYRKIFSNILEAPNTILASLSLHAY